MVVVHLEVKNCQEGQISHYYLMNIDNPIQLHTVKEDCPMIHEDHPVYLFEAIEAVSGHESVEEEQKGHSKTFKHWDTHTEICTRI